MKSTELTALGLPQDCLALALDTLKEGFKQKILTPELVRARVAALVAAPEAHVDDPMWGALARAVIASQATRLNLEANWGRNPYGRPHRFSQWGVKDDHDSIKQMAAACELPIAVAGALMPDNHLGYGLPIGGVLATYDSVVPYAVGVDIACRMMLNHHVIHERVTALAGAKVLASIENHHNFAWQGQHGDRELIVHREGATPAGEGVLGVIPGSMADPAFVVRGKGQPVSLRSASHGAGRRMSRSQAVRTFDWTEWKQVIRGRGVRLLSAGLDEVPGVHKDIREVMAQQTDLVRVVARFDPKIVRMSDDGQAED